MHINNINNSFLNSCLFDLKKKTYRQGQNFYFNIPVKWLFL